jgi:mRNA interferase MazF
MMKLMMTYKPFSLVVVPFPFTDSVNIKKRPAVVLSSEEFQKHTKHITLAMVTSAKKSEWFGDHLIVDLAATGLKAESVVRHKIFTLDSRLVIDCIGKLSLKDKALVSRQLQKHIKI